MTLSIEYCVTCNYRPIAASLAMNVKAATGMTAELTGSRISGALEITLNGELIFSKRQTNRFPAHEEIVAIIKGRNEGQP